MLNEIFFSAIFFTSALLEKAGAGQCQVSGRIAARTIHLKPGSGNEFHAPK
jgi:hypothetical protein